MRRVDTKRINEQVRRNIERFPERFRFQLSDDETRELVANCDRLEKLKHSSVNPYAFTEQGTAMLATVLKSDVAVKVSIAIRNEGVSAEIVTKQISETLALDIERHNRQYPHINIRESPRYHDRFLIVDDTVYHIGASLKDLGKKLFAFSRMEIDMREIMI